MIDLYNKYAGNTEVDLRNAELIERTTHVYKAWADSLGDVHLDVQINCTDKDGTGNQWIIPDLCVPMDGIIHLKTIKDPKYYMTATAQAWFEPRRGITLQQGYSESIPAPSEKILPYYVAVQQPDLPVKEMTLEEVEKELGYRVRIVSEEPIKKENI